MKKLRALFMGILFTAISGTANAGIPVIDATANANLILQYAEQILQYTTQLEELTEAVNQVTQLTNTFNSITGNRGLGTILNGSIEQAARRYIPSTYSDLASLSGLSSVPGYSELQSTVNTLKSSITTIDASSYADTATKGLFEARLNQLATEQALGQNAYGAVEGRTANIENLIATIGSTTDPKGIAELQARIAAEQALVQNENVRVNTLLYLQNVERDKRRQKEHDARAAARIKTLPPITF